MNIDFNYYHSYLMDADRIPYLVASIFLTIVVGMITGPLVGNANPFFWEVMDRIFGCLGDRMDRKNRKSADLILRGFILSVAVLVFALFAGRALSLYASSSSVVEIIIISLFITSGSVWYMILKLYFTLSQSGVVKGGYFGLSRSARIDLNSTDDFGITREGLAFSAISFDKGLVSPSVWYLIGGIPLMIIYSSLSFLAWRFGKCGFTTGFGRVPMALEKLMGFIPSLFSGFLYTASAAVSPTAKILESLKSWWQVKGKAPYEQGGVILSALAWPLGVSLGGPVSDISGAKLKKLWIGPKNASAKIDASHLKRGIIMNVMAHLFFILALLSAYIYSGKLF